MKKSSGKISLKILFLSAEADPFYKIGGLGDYAGSLPGALSALNDSNLHIDIRIVLPLHGTDGFDSKYPLKEIGKIYTPTRKGKEETTVFFLESDGLKYYLLKNKLITTKPTNVYPAQQQVLAKKYISFSLAILPLIQFLNWKPDIIHANDWHTSLTLYALRQPAYYQDQYKSIRTLLTIHNMPFMGQGTEKFIDNYNLQPSSSESLPVWARSLPLPLGIISADQVIAVSPTYAEELRTPTFGNGLENYFIDHAENLSGIINGIDTNKWDPINDKHIFFPFSIDDLAVREKNKQEIFKQFGWDDYLHTPLLVSISRLDNQKGIDLILDGIPKILHQKWKAVILGSGNKVYENAFRDISKKYPERMHAFIEYSAEKARWLYAGGDILLMPSFYEPCGLSQMIAMRYGCVPVAHAVGGLKDTITTSSEQNRTGFLFDKPITVNFLDALENAFNQFRDKPRWVEIQKNGMKKDFSWKRSAKLYADQYQKILVLSRSGPSQRIR